MNISLDPVHTVENLVAKSKTKTLSIYLVVVLVVITLIALMPIIEVNVSSQSRGIVRSSIEPVSLLPAVAGAGELYNYYQNNPSNGGPFLHYGKI